MERHEILEAMSELKLYGMRASFDEIAGKGLARRDELYPLIASLIRAERTHRQARSISYRIAGAKSRFSRICVQNQRSEQQFKASLARSDGSNHRGLLRPRCPRIAENHNGNSEHTAHNQ